MTDHDYGRHGAGTDETKLKQLSTLAKTQQERERAVTDAEAALKTAQQQLRDVAEHQIPELMEDCGMQKFTTSDGLNITVTETIRCSIPVAERGKAYAWLEEHGHGAMIKRNVNVPFATGEEEQAVELLKTLQAKYPGTDQTTKVESSTLRAWIAEELREGRDVPMDLFNAHKQTRAKVAVPKTKKKK